jgi:hypothetical protein
MIAFRGFTVFTMTISYLVLILATVGLLAMFAFAADAGGD